MVEADDVLTIEVAAEGAGAVDPGLVVIEGGGPDAQGRGVGAELDEEATG